MGRSHDAGNAAMGAEQRTAAGCDHGYKWELYNVKEDPTQFNDLAAQCRKGQGVAGRLRFRGEEVQRAAARQHDAARWNTPRPSLTAGRTEFTYSGELSGVPQSAAPSILNKSYTITADVEIPKGGAEGMIVTEGGRFGGYGLFLSKGVAGIRQRQAGVPLQPAQSQATKLLIFTARLQRVVALVRRRLRAVDLGRKDHEAPPNSEMAAEGAVQVDILTMTAESARIPRGPSG